MNDVRVAIGGRSQPFIIGGAAERLIRECMSEMAPRAVGPHRPSAKRRDAN